MAAGESRENPILRPTSRLVVLDEHDRILLFTTDLLDDQTARPFWFPPGGGVEIGESHEQAAVRELFEETGIVATLGPELWHREHTWPFRGQWIRSIERYYLVRVPETQLDRAALDDSLEMQPLAGLRWWSLDEVLATSEVLVPRELKAILPPVMAGHFDGLPKVVD